MAKELLGSFSFSWLCYARTLPLRSGTLASVNWGFGGNAALNCFLISFIFALSYFLFNVCSRRFNINVLMAIYACFFC